MNSKPSSVIMRQSKTDEARKSMEASYASAEVFRERAVQILQRKWNSVHTKQMSAKNYELPAWPEFQADSNGVLRTIEEILNEIFNVGGEKHGK